MPRKDQGTRSRAKVQLNKELEQIIPSEITAFANMGEEGEKKAHREIALEYGVEFKMLSQSFGGAAFCVLSIAKKRG